MVAAAIIGAAVVGAAGTYAAGSSAASATQNAANTAAGVQEQALAQQAQLAAPYTGLGQSAIPLYQQLLGIGGSPGSIQAALAQTPGYQFAQQQGETGILNAASAQGGVSGNTLAALDQFNTGLADQTYQSVLGDVQGAVGLGQAAAAGQASNIGTAAGNLSNIAINQGNNIAGIDASTIAGLTGSFGNAMNNYTTLQALGALNGQPGGGGNWPVSSGTDYAGEQSGGPPG